MTSKNPDPTGAEKPHDGETTIPADRKNFHTVPVDERRKSLFSTLKGGWLKTTAEIAGILSLVVAIIAIIIQYPDSPDPGSADLGSPDPDSPATLPNFRMFDDFEGPEIDPSNWIAGSNNTVTFYVEDGMLHLEVTPEASQGEDNDYAILYANLPGAITGVMFDMTLESRAGNDDGGGYAVVSSQEDREHRVALKVGTDDIPRLDYYICERATCRNGVYDDFRHPRPVPAIQIGQTYRVHIYQDDGDWVFDVDDSDGDFSSDRASDEDGPIESFAFNLFSSDEAFHVTVDNVQVAYA